MRTVRIAPRSDLGPLREVWEQATPKSTEMFQIDIPDHEWVRYRRLLKALHALENLWAERALRARVRRR